MRSVKTVAAAVAVVGLLAGCGSKDAPDTPVAETPTVTTTASAPGSLPPIEERAGGASLNDNRRSWTIPSEDFDDAQHIVPGRYSVEMFGSRPVWTPIDPLGDLPAKSDLRDGMDQCKDTTITLTGKTQIQYVKARYLVVNSESGPTSMEGAIPRGYAHSVSGAIIAAINQSAYGLYGRYDEIGNRITDAMWSTSAEAQREAPPNVVENNFRPMLIPAPTVYRVMSCSDDVVVVQVGFTLTGLSDEATVEVPLFWRDGDWVADFSGTADDKSRLAPLPSKWPADERVEIQYS